MCSVTKQYTLVPANGWWCLAAGKVTVGLTLHCPRVTDISGSPPTGSRSRRGRWAPAYVLLWSMVDSTFTLLLLDGFIWRVLASPICLGLTSKFPFSWMVLPEKAKQTPSVPVLNKHFPTPRWTCLKRLSGLHLPRFGITIFLLLDGFASPSKHCLPRFRIRVFLLLGYSRSAVPYSVIFGSISRGHTVDRLPPSATQRKHPYAIIPRPEAVVGWFTHIIRADIKMMHFLASLMTNT